MAEGARCRTVGGGTSEGADVKVVVAMPYGVRTAVLDPTRDDSAAVAIDVDDVWHWRTDIIARVVDALARGLPASS